MVTQCRYIFVSGFRPLVMLPLFSVHFRLRTLDQFLWRAEAVCPSISNGSGNAPFLLLICSTINFSISSA